MRPIDADALFEKFNNVPWFDNADRDDIALELVFDAPTIALPPNDPLTLEELRQMDGEPVWCVDGRGNQCWCLVNCDDGFPCCYDNETGLWEDCYYGMRGDDEFGLHKFGWLAYRRKPEEGTP